MAEKPDANALAVDLDRVIHEMFDKIAITDGAMIPQIMFVRIVDILRQMGLSYPQIDGHFSEWLVAYKAQFDS